MITRWLGVMGECGARTQGAAGMGHIWATEDEAACRPARSDNPCLFALGALKAEETLDLPPDRNGQQHARHEEDEKHEPESDSGAPRPLPMCDPGLSACSLQPNGVSDGLVVDDEIGRAHV